MTPIEIMAFIVAAIAAIKLFVIFINPKSWIKVTKTVFANPFLTTIILLALAMISLGYLITELTIVQIFAAMLFVMCLSALGFAAYSKEMLPLVNKMLKEKDILKKAWVSIAVWIVLIGWVLYELFA